MKSLSPLSQRFASFGVLPLAAALLLPALPCFAVTKVRVAVTENNASTTGSSATKTEKPEKAEKPAPKDKNDKTVKPATPPTKTPSTATGPDPYTHTANKNLTVMVGNTTTESLDVTVKVTFLGKDEAGKHEIVTEKTVENKLTLAPSKSETFTTEDVSFTHTSAHRVAPKGGAKGAKPENIPASGHAYAGYKVEVFQGSDLVGSAQKAGGF